MTSFFGLTRLRQTNTPHAEENNDINADRHCLTLLLFVGYCLTSVDKSKNMRIAGGLFVDWPISFNSLIQLCPILFIYIS